MPLFPKLGFKKKNKKEKPLDEKTVTAIMSRELNVHKNDVIETLRAIESDEEKRSAWNSLTKLQKLKVLRYIDRKRGDNAKK